MQHDDRYLDNAIDRTVRGMLDAEPPAGLRQRVLAEIEGSSTRRAWTLPRLAVVTALGAAAVVLAFATLFRPGSHDVPKIATTRAEPAARQPVNPAPSAGAATPVTVPDREPDVERMAHKSRPRRSMSQDRVVEAANIAVEGGVTIAPLTELDPIRFAPVEAPTIAVTAIGIDSIQVAPLRLDPLSSTPH